MNPRAILRQKSAVFALLAVLAAAVAAPYLIPENPDSATFRSGTFGLLLLAAAFVPVRASLSRADGRALCYGFAFAFVFALCLSLGSELTVYDQLLPGAGSLIRRLAVPVLATPLLGALISPVFCWTPRARARSGRGLPFAAYFLLFALCYGAVLLALFPGVISYDFMHEIAQFQSGVYEAAHPVFHTMLLGSLYALGEAVFGSMTAGAALYSAVQLLLLAAMYAGAMVFLQRRVPSRLAVAAIAAGFALLPFHGVLAVSTAKDPLFSGLCVLLCVQLWSIAEAPDAFLASRGRMARFALTCLGLALLRHNGVFAFAPACAALPLLCRGARRRAALLCAASLALCALVPRGLEAATGAVSIPSSELMSVPCQQLMRTASRAGLPDEEFDELSAWFTGQIDRYRPHCADPAKGGNFDFARYQANPAAFWSMTLRYAKAHPRVFLEAFLENAAGIWNPGDTSHAHALSTEDYDFIYLNTTYIFPEGEYDIAPRSLLPALQRLLYRSTHNARHENVPFLAQLFCPAIYTFGLLLATLRLCCKRRGALALCTLPLWGIFLSLLFSAGIFVRYAYPLMAGVPVLLALALAAPPREAE